MTSMFLILLLSLSSSLIRSPVLKREQVPIDKSKGINGRDSFPFQAGLGKSSEESEKEESANQAVYSPLISKRAYYCDELEEDCFEEYSGSKTMLARGSMENEDEEDFLNVQARRILPPSYAQYQNKMRGPVSFRRGLFANLRNQYPGGRHIGKVAARVTRSPREQGSQSVTFVRSPYLEEDRKGRGDFYASNVNSGYYYGRGSGATRLVDTGKKHEVVDIYTGRRSSMPRFLNRLPISETRDEGNWWVSVHLPRRYKRNFVAPGLKEEYSTKRRHFLSGKDLLQYRIKSPADYYRNDEELYTIVPYYFTESDEREAPSEEYEYELPSRRSLLRVESETSNKLPPVTPEILLSQKEAINTPPAAEDKTLQSVESSKI